MLVIPRMLETTNILDITRIPSQGSPPRWVRWTAVGCPILLIVERDLRHTAHTEHATNPAYTGHTGHTHILGALRIRQAALDCECN